MMKLIAGFYTLCINLSVRQLLKCNNCELRFYLHVLCTNRMCNQGQGCCSNFLENLEMQSLYYTCGPTCTYHIQLHEGTSILPGGFPSLWHDYQFLGFNMDIDNVSVSLENMR